MRPPPPTEVARFRADILTLAEQGTIALAVSGGPDSLALLLLAHAACPTRIAAATVDHGLRAEAEEEAAMVARLCARLGVDHATLPVTVTQDGQGLQAAARAARYAALGAWCHGRGASALATAHHLDDQAETLLMRLARGAGLAGLSAMRRARPMAEAPGVTLIRPLLGWRKADLERVAIAARLEPAHDPSNHDSRYDRTRARALLAGGWPAPERLAAVAARLGEAEDALAWSSRAIAAARLVVTDGIAQADPAGLPREHRRRLLLAGIAALAPGPAPRGEAIDRLLDALDRGAIATLAGLRCDPGPPWRLTRAAPRRAR